jgi:hypothetical protein
VKLNGLRPERPPKLEPETRRELSRCVNLLISPDEEERKAFVCRFMQQTAIPAARNLVLDRLVNVLVSGSEANRDRAAASLSEMGPAAFSAVKCRLLRTRSPRLQEPLAALLVRVGRHLPDEQQLDVPLPLELAAPRARSALDGRSSPCASRRLGSQRPPLLS